MGSLNIYSSKRSILLTIYVGTRWGAMVGVRFYCIYNNYDVRLAYV